MKVEVNLSRKSQPSLDANLTDFLAIFDTIKTEIRYLPADHKKSLSVSV